jgi:LysM repeat protein
VKPDGWKRYAAPAAFLLAVTIAVFLIRAGFESGRGTEQTVATRTQKQPLIATSTTTTTVKKPKPRRPAQRFTTVQAGDTFSVISARTHIPVATIARLNPNVSSTTLHIGQRIRIK